MSVQCEKLEISTIKRKALTVNAFFCYYVLKIFYFNVFFKEKYYE